MKYTFHPIANLFPMMSDEEIDALGADISEHGQREPIALYEGLILDGRNRYEACGLNDIEPHYREVLPADPFAFVASANLHRRHLDASQRSMIAATLATMKQGARTDLSPNGEKSQQEAAALLDVGKRSVERAVIVRTLGAPALVEAVEQGLVKVSVAAEFAQSTPPMFQASIISEHGSAAAAVRAVIKAAKEKAAQDLNLVENMRDALAKGDTQALNRLRADRAASKAVTFIDPKQAADRAEARGRVEPARRAYLAAVAAASLSEQERVNEVRSVMTAIGLQRDFGLIRVDNVDTKH